VKEDHPYNAAAHAGGQARGQQHRPCLSSPGSGAQARPADRLGRARSIASHPSNFSEHDDGDHADGDHGGGIENIEDVDR
jgi:hypothetical protein